MVLTHRGIKIDESDWTVFMGHVAATLSKLQVPAAERNRFACSDLKTDIVEAPA
jgi:hemoglobin